MINMTLTLPMDRVRANFTNVSAIRPLVNSGFATRATAFTGKRTCLDNTLPAVEAFLNAPAP
jgi:hypothetical protein